MTSARNIAKEMRHRIRQIEAEAEEALQLGSFVPTDDGQNCVDITFGDLRRWADAIDPRLCCMCQRPALPDDVQGWRICASCADEMREEREAEGESEDWPQCSCRYCMCMNATEYGEPCGWCVAGAHQG